VDVRVVLELEADDLRLHPPRPTLVCRVARPGCGTPHRQRVDRRDGRVAPVEVDEPLPRIAERLRRVVVRRPRGRAASRCGR